MHGAVGGLRGPKSRRCRGRVGGVALKRNGARGGREGADGVHHDDGGDREQSIRLTAGKREREAEGGRGRVAYDLVGFIICKH